MKRILKRLKEKETQDTYISLSEVFQGIHRLFNKYFSTLSKDVMLSAQPEKNKMIASCLNKTYPDLLHIQESEKGQELLNQIIESEKTLLDRISVFFSRIAQQEYYDRQPGANNVTISNILVIKQILEAHEINKRNNIYDGHGQELRYIQKALNLYKTIAQELNSYLIQQNKKEAQTLNDPSRYPNNGKLILIYTEDGKLNAKALNPS